MVRALSRNSISRLQLKFENRTLGVDVKANGVGLFAQVNWVFHLTRFAHSRSLTPDIRLRSTNYLSNGDGNDWFGDHFVRKVPPLDHPTFGRIAIRDLSELHLSFENDLSRDEANHLFFHYYDIGLPIKLVLDDFNQRLGPLTQSLGVHFRGTDKTDEAPRVRFEAVEAVIRRELSDNEKLDSIFVASDEAAFPEFIIRRFKDKRVLFFGDTMRSVSTDPLHLGNSKSGYALAREAIVDAFALSKCAQLVRTSSFLSAWSCIFNPRIPVTTLNKPFETKVWFPERVLMRKDHT